MIKIHENGKTYNVKPRAAYLKTIRSEKKLREVVKRSFIKIYGEDAERKTRFFVQCDILGILSYRAPIEK